MKFARQWNVLKTVPDIHPYSPVVGNLRVNTDGPKEEGRLQIMIRLRFDCDSDSTDVRL